jgi:hypothetical protein
MKLEFSHFVIIHLMQAGLLHVDGQRDRHDEFKVALRNFAFEPESYSCIYCEFLS